MDTEENKYCPVCGNLEIQRVFRVRFVIFAESLPGTDSFGVAYRCALGHVFFPVTFPQSSEGEDLIG